MGSAEKEAAIRLSAAELAEGMNVAVKNATRLVSDSEALFKLGSFSTSCSLSILSIEESGKVSILRGMAMAQTDEEWKARWKDYRSHKRKNYAWLLPDLVQTGARTIDALSPLVDKNSAHPTYLDQLKQSGFYTDFFSSGRTWASPERSINQHLAESMLTRARSLVSSRVHTAREIELWTKHLGPVGRLDLASMKRGVLEWHKEMIAEGLSDDSAETWETFLFGSVVLTAESAQ